MSLDIKLPAGKEQPKPYHQAIDDLDCEIKLLTDNLLTLERRLSSFMNIGCVGITASKDVPKENNSEAVIVIKTFKDELRNNNCFITSIIDRLEI